MVKDMNSDDDLVGLSLLSKKGVVVESVGTSYGNMLNEILKEPLDAQKIVGPFKIREDYYVYVVTPIKGSNHVLFSLFSLAHLEETLHKKLRTRFGQVIVAYLNHDHVEIFSPEDKKWQAEALEFSNSLVHSLREAIADSQQGLITGHVFGKKSLISYSPVRNSKWGVAVVVNQQHFYSSLKLAIFHLCLVTIGITIIFLLGLQRLLSPLSGKLIMHNDVLEKKISDALVDLKQANIALERAALYDALTDVLNRRGLEERITPLLSRLKRQKGTLLMLYLDVNKFKEINDGLGHEAGDVVLKETARRLKASLRQEDIVARLGGDEFLVLIADEAPEKAKVIIHKLKEACALPINFHQQRLNCSISVGLACYPSEGEDYQALIKVADQRMYQDKRG
jgi:diguanylate cyclase (GGDEF)-like protein